MWRGAAARREAYRLLHAAYLRSVEPEAVRAALAAAPERPDQIERALAIETRQAPSQRIRSIIEVAWEAVRTPGEDRTLAEGALRALEDAYRMESRGVTRKGHARVVRGLALYRLRRYAEAKDAFEAADRRLRAGWASGRLPDRVEMRLIGELAITMCQWQLGERPEARTALEQIIIPSGDRGDALLSLLAEARAFDPVALRIGQTVGASDRGRGQAQSSASWPSARHRSSSASWPSVEGATVRDVQQAGGVGARDAGEVGGAAGRNELGEAIDDVAHQDRGAGQRAGRVANFAACERDALAAELVHAGGHRGGGHAVGDQDRALGAEAVPGGAQHHRVHVHAVGDQRARQALLVHRAVGQAGTAVVQAAHRVEEVRGVARAGFDAVVEGGGVGGVPDRDLRSVVAEAPGGRGGTGQRGRERDQAQLAAGRLR